MIFVFQRTVFQVPRYFFGEHHASFQDCKYHTYIIYIYIFMIRIIMIIIMTIIIMIIIIINIYI